MEEVDGFNPGGRHGRGLRARPEHAARRGLSYAASLARLGNVEWEGSPLAEHKRPGSFLERQVPQFLRLLESYRHERLRPESLAVDRLADWLRPTARPMASPGSCTATRI